MPAQEDAYDHVLPFMQGMSKPWTIAGYVFFAMSLAAGIMVLIDFPFGPNGHMMPGSKVPDIGPKMAVFNMITIFLGMASGLMGLGWTLVDLIDRRGNYRWLLAFMPCCAFGSHAILLGLYIFFGRKVQS